MLDQDDSDDIDDFDQEEEKKEPISNSMAAQVNGVQPTRLFDNFPSPFPNEALLDKLSNKLAQEEKDSLSN